MRSTHPHHSPNPNHNPNHNPSHNPNRNPDHNPNPNQPGAADWPVDAARAVTKSNEVTEKAHR